MKRLKILRKEKGLSQLQLAEFLHISPSTVAQWELGKKNACLGQVLTLCRILCCSPKDLFSMPENNYAENSISVPVFSTGKHTQVSFLPLPSDQRLSTCQFGVVIPHDLSGRICKGDICYFEPCRNICENDVVVSLDHDSNETIFIAEKNSIFIKNIVAVCRFMQSRF